MTEPIASVLPEIEKDPVTQRPTVLRDYSAWVPEPPVEIGSTTEKRSPW